MKGGDKIDTTLEKYGEALLSINQFAKIQKSRKQNHYRQQKWKQATKAKHKQRQLYKLKNDTIRNLEKLSMVEKVGLHSVDNKMLTSVKVGGYKFHILPTNDELLKLKYLGTYNSETIFKMSDIRMPICDAKELIKDLTSNNKEVFV